MKFLLATEQVMAKVTTELFHQYLKRPVAVMDERKMLRIRKGELL